MSYSHNIYHNNNSFSVNEGQILNSKQNAILTISCSRHGVTRNDISHFFKSFKVITTHFLSVNTRCVNFVFTVHYKSDNRKPNSPCSAFGSHSR